jgi:hypothetical protein
MATTHIPSNVEYVRVMQRHVEQSVTDTTIMATYHREQQSTVMTADHFLSLEDMKE